MVPLLLGIYAIVLSLTGHLHPDTSGHHVSSAWTEKLDEPSPSLLKIHREALILLPLGTWASSSLSELSLLTMCFAVIFSVGRRQTKPLRHLRDQNSQLNVRQGWGRGGASLQFQQSGGRDRQQGTLHQYYKWRFIRFTSSQKLTAR